MYEKKNTKKSSFQNKGVVPIQIEFSKLEYGTTFASFTGRKWVKISDNAAVTEQSDQPCIFSPFEIVKV